MTYFLEPGHIGILTMTPEHYQRMMARQQPNLWPVYFAMSRMSHTIQDLLMKKLQVDNITELQDNIPLMLSAAFEAASKQKDGGPAGDIAALRADLERLYGGLYDNWKAGVWHGVGAAYSSAMEQFLSTGQLLYGYKALMYHVAVTPRMRRHWNQVYTPMYPDVSMAFNLYRRGQWTYDQFKKAAAYDGWPSEYYDLLIKAMELLPSPREAFYLWCKGHLTDEERDSLYAAGGYDPVWHMMLTDNWQYTPTIYDLTRMADYIELDQVWALEAMKRRGVRAKDRAKIWEMLQKRPLRDEIFNITNKWLWRYQYGRCTLDELKNALVSLDIRTKEREYLVIKAEMDREDELITEWIEILMWRFRTALITEDQYLEGLMNLGIGEEKANLMVEVEKAKGYYGYY